MPGIIRDLMAIAGSTALGTGLWLVSRELALIVGGVLLLGASVVSWRQSVREEPPKRGR